MIQADLYLDRQGLYTGFSAKGHSDYAEEGSDIVCAAVSVLSVTCANALESVCGVVPAVEALNSGLLTFSLPDGLTAQQRHDSQILMAALAQGLRDVAEGYPDDIHFSLRRTEEKR